MATSDLISYFNWFKQLVELRGMALGRSVEFFKKAKEVIFVLMPLLCDEPVCTFPAGDHYIGYRWQPFCFDDVSWQPFCFDDVSRQPFYLVSSPALSGCVFASSELFPISTN